MSAHSRPANGHSIPPSSSPISGRRPSVVGHRVGELREPDGRVREAALGVCVAVAPRRQQRHQVEVERVAVVVRRSFRVPAVGEHLAVDFLEQDSASGVSPIGGWRRSSGSATPAT